MTFDIALAASRGICVTLNSAERVGLMMSEEIDQILTRAAADAAAMAGNEPPGEIVGSAGDCDEALQRLSERAE